VQAGLWMRVNPGGVLPKLLFALWAVRGDLGKGSIRLVCIYFSQKFITNGLVYPGFSFSGLHKYYHFLHLYLTLFAKWRAPAVV